ncbi:hypothetical protein [Flavobacterium sp.]|uniref:hypothetical protein n=1 Tax=Flavobacterium sp. TaxID=239 RepID=UPI002B4AC129|nr:hypothetical protein [Flavobacterium sp.]HLP65524.1 hypothetical protein [Flavobacterium sp.]
MKRHYYALVGIYILSLVFSVFGFLVDSDPNTNSISMNIFEIVMLSFMIFGMISGVIYGLYLMYYLIVKKLLKQKLVD